MVKLAMAALLSHLLPSVFFEESNYLLNIQGHEFIVGYSIG